MPAAAMCLITCREKDATAEKKTEDLRIKDR
jgi:hypothetical protein